MDLMHLRLSAILELLQSGLNVWFTGMCNSIQRIEPLLRLRRKPDVDAVFNLDPFPFLSKKNYQARTHLLDF
jgi:hypothetical protein